MDPRMREPRAHLRLSDADREAALARLAEHYAAGRLDKDEFDERSDAVWSARTGADLAPVFADLPSPVAPRHPRRRRGFPLVPVLALVVAILVLTHLPLVLLALVLWCVLARGRHISGRRRRVRGSWS